jgi:hypothetical protein
MHHAHGVYDMEKHPSRCAKARFVELVMIVGVGVDDAAGLCAQQD